MKWDFYIMQWRKHISDWLYFSRKERLGIYIMGFLITMLWILPVFFSKDIDPIEPLQISIVQIDSLEKILIREVPKYPKRISGLGSSSNQGKLQKFTLFKNESTKISVLNLNTADSLLLEQLPGIGEKLSARIVKYRERLGGYIEISQLKEVYGLSDSNYIKCKDRMMIEDGFSPLKLKLNKANYQELRRHPYISHLFAKSVLAYIKMHASVKDLEELLTIGSLSREEVLKAAPYLDFGL